MYLGWDGGVAEGWGGGGQVAAGQVALCGPAARWGHPPPHPAQGAQGLFVKSLLGYLPKSYQKVTNKVTQKVTEKLPVSYQKVTKQVTNKLPMGYQKVTNKLQKSYQTVTDKLPKSYRKVTEIPNSYRQVSKKLPKSHQKVTKQGFDKAYFHSLRL